MKGAMVLRDFVNGMNIGASHRPVEPFVVDDCQFSVLEGRILNFPGSLVAQRSLWWPAVQGWWSQCITGQLDEHENGRLLFSTAVFSAYQNKLIFKL
jgi:hypothetical protein